MNKKERRKRDNLRCFVEDVRRFVRRGDYSRCLRAEIGDIHLGYTNPIDYFPVGLDEDVKEIAD